MDAKTNYSECELRYIDQGYDLARAAETCAEVEDRSFSEEAGESSQKGSREDYYGDI